jgi:predicted nuclease of restriction endonuclease-like (RecB) superfamily
MLINGDGYFEILESVKEQIKSAQYKAVLGLNREQISLYWNIGKVILDNSKYGNKFIENLAHDIKSEFPKSKGYSVRNLKYMRKFADFVNDFEIVQTVSAQFSWSHNITLLDKTKTLSEYLWYADRIIQEGLSISVLENKIELKNFERQAIAGSVNNYERILPSIQHKLALETLKSPYVFEFIQKHDDIIEREIENELVANIAKTLLELGTGFAFVGNQYHLSIANRDYYIDLLFYNTKLRCYVVIELKAGEFKPEYAGKLNFYLSAIDDMLKHENDNPSIGIMLCKERDKLTAEYALKDMNKPIGVSEYKLSDFVPSEFADTLPSAADIEKRIKEKYQLDDGGDKE